MKDRVSQVALGLVTIILLCGSGVDATSCNESLPCTTSDGRIGVCLKSQCRTAMLSVPRDNLNFIIRVKYPEHKIKETSTDLLIKGNGLGLSWTDGLVMNKTNTDTWEINIKYQSTIDGFSCQNCADNTKIKDKFQYRIFTLSGKNMKGGNFAIDLPVSMTSSYFPTPPVFEVHPWFYSSYGQSKSFTINSTEIGQTRTLYYYLPPSFDENTYKRYPNILAFDIYPGELATMFGNGLDELLSRSGTIQEVVVIGYGDYQPSHERDDLLTPTPGDTLYCRNGTFEDFCNGCIPNNITTVDEFDRLMKDKCGKIVLIHGRGNKLLDFYINEVRPKIQELTHSRLLVDQPNTGVLGYSLGGLMSCHAVWTLSNVFGFAACQSPSFWWPRVNGTGDCKFDFINATMEDDRFKSRIPTKILLDGGGYEVDAPYYLTPAMIEAGQKMINHHKYVMNKDVWVSVYPNSHHSSTEWSYRIWTALQTLVPTPGDSNIPSTMDGQSVNASAGSHDCCWLVLCWLTIFCHFVF